MVSIEEEEGQGKSVEIGIYYTCEEFIQEATKLKHPFAEPP